MDCTIRVAKTKALISFAVTAKLICVFVFAYAKSWFSHDAAHIVNYGLQEYTRFSFVALNIDFGYSLGRIHHTSYVQSKNKKTVTVFYLQMICLQPFNFIQYLT